MTGKNSFEWIDRLLNEDLSHEEKLKLKEMLSDDEELNKEIKLQQEIKDAILEEDVMTLRQNLSSIVNSTNNVVFDLSNEFSTLKNDEFLLSETNEQEIENSLQRIHYRSHKIAITETTTDLTAKKQLSDKNIANQNDEKLLLEIEKAIQEDDIINLRNNIGNIVYSDKNSSFSDFDIDQYLTDDFHFSRYKEITETAKHNKTLLESINLHREIDEAINESDIQQLRNSIQNIYFKNDLKQMDVLDEFHRNDDFYHREESLSVNDSIKKMNSEINESIQEDDVIQLRNSVNEIINKKQNRNNKTLSFEISNRLKWISIAASIIIIFSIGLTFLKRESIGIEQAYVKYYEPYDTHLNYRSSINEYKSKVNKGIKAYADKKYDLSINYLEDANEPKGIFYLGLAHLGNNEYMHATKAFEEVIKHENNLFVEQAEWYNALCYVGLNDINRAIKSLNKIATGDSHYKDKAKKLLKDMR